MGSLLKQGCRIVVRNRPLIEHWTPRQVVGQGRDRRPNPGGQRLRVAFFFAAGGVIAADHNLRFSFAASVTADFACRFACAVAWPRSEDDQSCREPPALLGSAG